MEAKKTRVCNALLNFASFALYFKILKVITCPSSYHYECTRVYSKYSYHCIQVYQMCSFCHISVSCCLPLRYRSSFLSIELTRCIR